jgi:hypothetical protein
MIPNRPRLTRPIAAAALCALLLAVAAFTFSSMREVNEFKDATTTRIFKHQIGDHGAHLRAGLALTAGKAAVTLRDGAGVEVWKRSFKPGKLVAEADIEGIAGTVQVEVALDRATGQYDVSLRSR